MRPAIGNDNYGQRYSSAAPSEEAGISLLAKKGIPAEVLKFFQTPGGHSVIVKGSAGTGKTTFALQLTEELGGINSSYYMSTRVSDTTLYNQFPWLKDRVRAGENMVAGRHYSRMLGQEPVLVEEGTQISLEMRILGEKAQSKAVNASGRKVDRSELLKLEGRIEMGEEGEDEEFKGVGEGEVKEDSLIFDLGSDLPEIDMAYDAVEKNLPERTLVVIDSIDALSERYGLSSSKLINVLQKDLVESSMANVLYVLENSGETKLDYLGDGVIMFRSDEYGGRRLRTMSIEKLRGSEVRQHKYLYTLDGGRLRAFESSRHSRPAETSNWSAVPDPSKECVSTGHVAIDALIGGLREGGLGALEIGANVPTEFVDELRTGLICNFATMGRGVAHVPPGKAGAESVKQMAGRYLAEDVFDKRVRVFESTPMGTLEESKSAIHVEGSNIDTDLKWNNVEYHLPSAKHPFLSLMAFDTLESVYGPSVLEGMSGHIAAVRRSKDIFIGTSTATTASNQKLADLASVHVKLQIVAGTVLLYCEKPYTEIYHLAFDYSGGFPQIVLTPLV